MSSRRPVPSRSLIPKQLSPEHPQVTPDMRIAWEEPFGPVVPVIRISTVEQGIEHCNSNNVALQVGAPHALAP